MNRLDERATVVWTEVEDQLRSSLIVPADRRLVEWAQNQKAEDLDLPLHRYRRVVELSLTGGRNLHPHVYADRYQDLEILLQRYWRNRLTWRELGPRWVANFFSNLKSLNPIQILTPPRPGTIPVVLGAGPDVEHHLGQIARYRDKFWVLVCDSILPACLDHGVRPDLTACLESQHHNLNDFAPAVQSGLSLVMDLSAHPSQGAVTGGPVFWTLTEFAPLQLFTRIKNLPLPVLWLPPLGSVGNYALQIALQLWEGEVLVAGLDFCFPLGKTHARGSAHHRHLLQHSHRLAPPETRGLLYPSRPDPQSCWRTTPNLMEYRRLFLDQGIGRIRKFNVNSLSSGTPRWKGYEFNNSYPKNSLDSIFENLVHKVDILKTQLRQGDPDIELLKELDFLWFWDASYPEPKMNTGFLHGILIETERFLRKYSS